MTVPSLISLLGAHIALPTRCVCYCTSPTCAGAQLSVSAPQLATVDAQPPAAA